MMSQFLKNIRQTEWGYLLDFVSPTFFEVVPFGGMMVRVGGLMKSYVAPWPAHTFDLPTNVKLDLSIARENQMSKLSDELKEKIGESILTLYFWQLFNNDLAIIDLRPQTFVSKNKSKADLLWHPHSLVVRWDSVFLSCLRNIYSGFYHSDWVKFDTALSQLGLLPAKDTFLKSFAQDQQENTSFEIKNFISVFHEIFLQCKSAKKQIHPDFIYLGIYLATLYESLESLGKKFNVARCFEKASLKK